MTKQETLNILLNEPLSQRIRRGLIALEKAEQPGALVKPKMETWHTIRDGQCFACLGGLAVIDLCDAWEAQPSIDDDLVHILSDPQTDMNEWSEIDSAISRYKMSLDDARNGYISAALAMANRDPESMVDWDDDVPDYHEHPVLFKEIMMQMVEALEEKGL